jgi:hypothetical protein
MTYQDQVGVEECHIRTRWMSPHTSGPDMSFLHMHLVRICNSSTCRWSGYVIPPHQSGPWRNDISGPDACGGMTYPDRMNVEESHIHTWWMWWNDVSGPDVCMWRNDISGPDICGGIYVIPPHASGPDMSFIHIHTSRSDMSFLHTHLVRICHSSTPIWSGYVIPPHD